VRAGTRLAVTDPQVDHKAIVITGASSGIGATLARRLSGPGRVLGLIGRNQQRLETVAAECTAAGASCRSASIDIRDSPRLRGFLDDFDRDHPIDLLVANAGILDGRHGDQVAESGETARRVLEINLLAAVDTVHAVLPAMCRRRSGGIIIVSSLAAFVPLADAPAYSASKAALVSYAVALRDAVEGEGVKVMAACPGFVATPMADIHLGPRPGEISADEAATHILEGFRRDKALVGFPSVPFWLSRLSLLVPEFVRRRGARSTRFHVASPPPGTAPE
jgi:short-subunit dehydrogenase